MLEQKYLRERTDQLRCYSGINLAMLLLKMVSTYILQNIANCTAQWSGLAIRAVRVKVLADEARREDAR